MITTIELPWYIWLVIGILLAVVLPGITALAFYLFYGRKRNWIYSYWLYEKKIS